MGYDLHIKRASAIPLDEWKRAVASVPGVRLDDSPATVTNPATGVRVAVDGNDGDVAVLVSDEWVKVFRYFRGGVRFKAAPGALTDPNDPVARAALSLSRILDAKVVGDDGAVYA
jgi:hypothetical protein